MFINGFGLRDRRGGCDLGLGFWDFDRIYTQHGSRDLPVQGKLRMDMEPETSHIPEKRR